MTSVIINPVAVEDFRSRVEGRVVVEGGWWVGSGGGRTCRRNFAFVEAVVSRTKQLVRGREPAHTQHHMHCAV